MLILSCSGKCKQPKMTRTILKNQVGGFILSDIKSDYKVTLIKMWCWHKNKENVGGKNRLTKTDLQLSYEKIPLHHHRGTMVFLIIGAMSVGDIYIVGLGKREKSWLLIFPHTIHNLNFRWMINIHLNFKIIKLLKENRDCMILKINKYFN